MNTRITTCSGHTLSSGFCLTGRSPPRKSEVSMCKWQLTEYNLWSAKAANIWQRVVFPHLWDTHTGLARSVNFKHASTNTPSSRARSPGESLPKATETAGPRGASASAGVPQTPAPYRLLPGRASAAWPLWNGTLPPDFTPCLQPAALVHRIPMPFPPASPVAACPRSTRCGWT